MQLVYLTLVCVNYMYSVLGSLIHTPLFFLWLCSTLYVYVPSFSFRYNSQQVKISDGESGAVEQSQHHLLTLTHLVPWHYATVLLAGMA